MSSYWTAKKSYSSTWCFNTCSTSWVLRSHLIGCWNVWAVVCPLGVCFVGCETQDKGQETCYWQSLGQGPQTCWLVWLFDLATLKVLIFHGFGFLWPSLSCGHFSHREKKYPRTIRVIFRSVANMVWRVGFYQKRLVNGSFQLVNGKFFCFFKAKVWTIDDWQLTLNINVA